MKKIFKMKNSVLSFIIGICFLSIPFGGHSQDDNNINADLPSLNVFHSKSSEMNFLSNQDFSTNISAVSTSNNVNIKQIGNFNKVIFNTNSAQSEIELLQNGDYNNIQLELNALRINEKVIQNGNRNSFTDINTFGTNLHEAEIIQNGNNQNITWYGDNSISEKMKVNMQGNDKILVVRNFN